jgi:hypothetical protein
MPGSRIRRADRNDNNRQEDKRACAKFRHACVIDLFFTA